MWERQNQGACSAVLLFPVIFTVDCPILFEPPFDTLMFEVDTIYIYIYISALKLKIGTLPLSCSWHVAVLDLRHSRPLAKGLGRMGVLLFEGTPWLFLFWKPTGKPLAHFESLRGSTARHHA